MAKRLILTPKPRVGARIGRRYACPGIGPAHSFVLDSHRQEYCTPACRKASDHYRTGALAPSKSRDRPTYPPCVLTPQKPNKNGHRILSVEPTEEITDARALRRHVEALIGRAVAAAIEADKASGAPEEIRQTQEQAARRTLAEAIAARARWMP